MNLQEFEEKLKKFDWAWYYKDFKTTKEQLALCNEAHKLGLPAMRMYEEYRKNKGNPYCSLQEAIQVHVHDVVVASFYGKLIVGIVEMISDGSERGIPGELMYFTRNKSDGHALWLRENEILRFLSQEEIRDELQAFNRLLAQLNINL